MRFVTSGGVKIALIDLEELVGRCPCFVIDLNRTVLSEQWGRDRLADAHGVMVDRMFASTRSHMFVCGRGKGWDGCGESSNLERADGTVSPTIH